MGTVWTDGIQLAQNRDSAVGFQPAQLSLEDMKIYGKLQNAKLRVLDGSSSIEEDERLMIEGYLSHKWGILLPSEHPGLLHLLPLKLSPEVQLRLVSHLKHLLLSSLIVIRPIKPTPRQC